MARARRNLTLDERIEKAEKKMLAYKEKYEESMAELKTLLDKRNEKQHEEIIEKFIKNKKTFDELIAFLDDEGGGEETDVSDFDKN